MRVLVLFAHPGQAHSKMNRSLANVAKAADGVTFVDLYAENPRFKIDIDAQQKRVLEHDVIIFQFPIYWYSTPSLLKEWQDLVLEYGFAYGPNGDKLKGKIFLPVVTAGGPEQAYSEGGYNHFSLRTLLSPLEQTANLCLMTFMAPLTLYSAQRAKDDGRAEAHIATYRKLLAAFTNDTFDIEATRDYDLLTEDALNQVLED